MMMMMMMMMMMIYCTTEVKAGTFSVSRPIQAEDFLLNNSRIIKSVNFSKFLMRIIQHSFITFGES
jgi:hypothetical protein